MSEQHFQPGQPGSDMKGLSLVNRSEEGALCQDDETMMSPADYFFDKIVLTLLAL